MIYVLIPIWAEWDDIRLFTTYSAMESEVLQRANLRKLQGSTQVEWCSVTAYDGADELKPVWKYYINRISMRLDRVPAVSQ